MKRTLLATVAALALAAPLAAAPPAHATGCNLVIMPFRLSAATGKLSPVTSRVPISIVAFTARPPAGDPDRFGEEVLQRVNARRKVFLSSTRLDGRYVLRICTVSFRSHADRVDEAVNGLIEEARALARTPAYASGGR